MPLSLKHKSPTNQNMLIIAPAWVGDMVMAQTLLKFLKAHYPQMNIDVVAPVWTFPLLERMPEIRNAFLFPLGHGQLKLKVRYSFAKKLRNYNYDQAIVLSGSFKSALTAFLAKIPLRTGWLGEWRFGILNDYRYLNKITLPLMIEQFVALGLAKNALLPSLLPYYPQLQVDKLNQQRLLDKFGLTTQQPIIALCPGAEYGPAKRWPAAYFAQIAQQKITDGWQVWILGSPKDQQFAQVIGENNCCVDLTGRTSLAEAIDLLALTQAVITNDSGLMHIAAALQRPLVVLYGSSTPQFTPPLTDKVAMIHLALTCSPCFKRICPLKHFDCMNKISPQWVVSKLNNLIHNEQNFNC